MKNSSFFAVSALAVLFSAACAFSQEKTNAPASAEVAFGPASDAQASVTGKVLALRDKDGKFSSVKLLADHAVYHVTLDEKAMELAETARFKSVEARGPVVEEKPVGAASPRKVITVTWFTLLEPPVAPPAETNALAAAGAPAATNLPAVTNSPPAAP
jgi:hypothetical protein